MCGICGYAVPRRAAYRPDDAVLLRMREAIQHRGPDDAGHYCDAQVALGHRRLSIVDLGGGHQPMVSGDGRYVIVYNGEVYNHLDLRRELEGRGRRFRTSCDTEAVLEAVVQFGRLAPTRLRGMFAFAVWDRQLGTLTLARDRFGIKPLYYAVSEGGALVFGSEIKAILASGLVDARLRLDSLPDLMANHATSDHHTLFEGIYRLPAAHVMSWRDGELTLERYWKLSMKERLSGSTSRLASEYRERLWEAVRLRLMSDVPLGVFLSGGIDSAAITAAMADHVGPGINSFSVAFRERHANELRYARLVSSRCATRHHEILVTPREFLRRWPRLVWHEDEPIAHPSSVPLNFVSELASRHVKVVLTGEGSDETLAGYNRYRITLLNLGLGKAYERAVPSALQAGVRRCIAALPRSWATRRRLLRTFLTLPANVDQLYFENFAVFGRERQTGLLSGEVREAIGQPDPYAHLRGLALEADTPELLNQLLYTDMMSYLHELLMKQDQMSMAASIESRVPFLDHELVEWASALPPDMKLRRMSTKRVLREAVEHDLPPEILSRRKMGFPVPVGDWFRSWARDWLGDLISGSRARARGLFDPSAVERLVAEHAAGHANHDERLWMLANIEVWHRVVLENESPEDLGECLAEAAPEDR